MNAIPEAGEPTANVSQAPSTALDVQGAQCITLVKRTTAAVWKLYGLEGRKLVQVTVTRENGPS